jgi:hypothetical protein
MMVRPIILTRDEVRFLLEWGEVLAWRVVPSKAAGEILVERLGLVHRLVGQRLWAKESFSTRGGDDGETVRIRYPADGHAGEARVVPLDVAGSRYASDGYFTHQAKHMPRWASRLIVELVDAQLHAGRVAIRLKLVSEEARL